MRFCYFVFFHDPDQPERRIDPADITRIAELVQGTPNLALGLIYTPETAHDIYLHDGTPPQLGLQLYFEELTQLEWAIAADGHLQQLAAPEHFPSLAGLPATQQVMLARRFPVANEWNEDDAGPPCSYLVHYTGPAHDFNAWIRHYIAHHPPIMARFPGIRQIEILTRVDWFDAMPWTRVHHMQRNRVMFDSPAALTAALQSPVRHEMRADFHNFPKFDGENLHFPMATHFIRPSR